MDYQIRARREQLRMTQEELARKSGISRSTVSALENGTAHSTVVSTLQKIAYALDTTVADLFFEQSVNNFEQKEEGRWKDELTR